MVNLVNQNVQMELCLLDTELTTADSLVSDMGNCFCICSSFILIIFKTKLLNLSDNSSVKCLIKRKRKSYQIQNWSGTSEMSLQLEPTCSFSPLHYSTTIII